MRLPNPDNYRDWKTFARDLVKALENPPTRDRVLPQVVLLQTITSDVPVSAAQTGLLMYDPLLGPVYSQGGEWVPFGT